MSTIEEVEGLIRACLGNAEKLLDAAKLVAQTGSNHISYHLTVLALEEIGKSSLIFVDSLRMVNPPSEDAEARKTPMDWMEDHERKIFWAIWLPEFGEDSDWRTIPKYIDLAKQIHENRLRALYFDPRNPAAQVEFTDDLAHDLIKFTEFRLSMETAKKYKDLNDEEKSNLQWFFTATHNPETRPFIFSKASLEKQNEFKEERDGWIKWLRKTFEDSHRVAIEMTNREMQRVRPEGDESYADKWLFKIKLKSWSHSIRPNQLTQWNGTVQKIKLFSTNDKSELIVQFTMPKSVPMQAAWPAGMHNCVVFVTSLNIATMGFFWWYLPTFISRFHDSIIDVETNGKVDIDRTPQLKMGWPYQALKQELLQSDMAIIFGFVAHAAEEQFAVYKRYFGVLGLMAKNDIFFQFEHNLVVDFSECFEMALKAYRDWDGDGDTFDGVIAGLFGCLSEGGQLVALVEEIRGLADQVRARQIQQPITLEHVGKAKIIFDIYIRLKATAYVQAEIESGNLLMSPEVPNSRVEG